MKTYAFSITVVGHGDDKNEAWEDARQSMEQKAADGDYDDAELLSDTNDLQERQEFEELKDC